MFWLKKQHLYPYQFSVFKNIHWRIVLLTKLNVMVEWKSNKLWSIVNIYFSLLFSATFLRVATWNGQCLFRWVADEKCYITLVGIKDSYWNYMYMCCSYKFDPIQVYLKSALLYETIRRTMFTSDNYNLISFSLS